MKGKNKIRYTSGNTGQIVHMEKSTYTPEERR
jgi:hypothetical protein